MVRRVNLHGTEAAACRYDISSAMRAEGLKNGGARLRSTTLATVGSPGEGYRYRISRLSRSTANAALWA